jgi:hypothetical protein
MESLAEKIKYCRICDSTELQIIVDFGDMSLTGVFLEDGNKVPTAPLCLIRCETCGLVQLAHNYDQNSLYGDSYGYESHLNSSMVTHLNRKARVLEEKWLPSNEEQTVVDIASNDGTLLSGYRGERITRIGIDPLIDVVSNFYPENSIKIADFFSSKLFFDLGTKPADLVTSLSVIYDLHNPVDFARQVHEILSDEGIWHFEQSYLPLMLETNSYDTVCHEHLLYLSLADIKNILNASGFQIVDVSLNNTNGGSIAVTAKKSKLELAMPPFASYLLRQESNTGLTNGTRIENFAEKYKIHAIELQTLLSEYSSCGYEVIGVGASTKGNVLLQAAGIDSSLIRVIGEINPRKFGKQTPGSSIPIVPESAVLDRNPENTLAVVLPWHFRENLLPKFDNFIRLGGSVLFPLPRIEVVSY